ncbi:hypothetical protein OE88DRAFT_1529739 [Heliocybe sulcata]|uniref:Uncharacterized protein n=1 Tax=Heliocybe sulcata TaxID=5364 RepID=A0A5C3N1F2_9AGAM|nr:hypothetical protein OE88DRAFT_1529739 [Heliocybe sulcata]
MATLLECLVVDSRWLLLRRVGELSEGVDSQDLDTSLLLTSTCYVQYWPPPSSISTTELYSTLRPRSKVSRCNSYRAWLKREPLCIHFQWLPIATFPCYAMAGLRRRRFSLSCCLPGWSHLIQGCPSRRLAGMEGTASGEDGEGATDCGRL